MEWSSKRIVTAAVLIVLILGALDGDLQPVTLFDFQAKLKK